MSDIVRYGIISDTHGTLDPHVFEAFEGVRRIYHCGDIGSPVCAADLETIAPLRAVQGNMDPWAVVCVRPEKLVEDAEFGIVAICHGARFGHRNDHIVKELARLFAASRPRVVLFGHSHEPFAREIDGVLFVNPGSASHPLRGAVPTVALLEYDPDVGSLTARHIALVSDARRTRR